MQASDIFQGDYIFDKEIMGVATSQEIQETFLRTTPIYLRGCSEYPDVKQLLDVPLSSGKHVRDIVRHLRVYLRFERFTQEQEAVRLGIISSSCLFQEGQFESAFFKTYSARLDGLDQLPFKDHKIKIELCVFRNERPLHLDADDERDRSNLYETVKPAYYRARSTGADISVHWENYSWTQQSSGRHADATELYVQNAEDWENVNQRSHQETSNEFTDSYRADRNPITSSPSDRSHQ